MLLEDSALEHLRRATFARLPRSHSAELSSAAAMGPTPTPRLEKTFFIKALSLNAPDFFDPL